MGRPRRRRTVDYGSKATQPTACRLPHDARHILDWLAMTMGADVTPSMLMRAFIEQGLAGLGFPLARGVTSLPWPDRGKVEAWLRDEATASGAEPGPAAGRAAP